MRLPLIHDISTKDGASNKNSRMFNVLAERRANGSGVASVRPGLNQVVAGSGSGNNMVCFNGNLVNIFGADIKRVTTGGGYTLNDPNTGSMARLICNELRGAHVDQMVLTKGHGRYTGNYSPTCYTSGDDPLNSYVVLRLRFEGADGSTTITDDAGHTINNPSGLQIDTDQYSCGASSLLFGNGALTFNYSTDWNLGTGDFCFEFRIRFYDLSLSEYSAADTSVFYTADTSTPGGYGFMLGSEYGIDDEVDSMAILIPGVTTVAVAHFTALSENVWYSFAYSRTGGIIRLFLDGQLIQEEDTNTYSLTSIGTVGAGFYDFALMP